MLHGVQLISKPNISQNGLIYLARLQVGKASVFKFVADDYPTNIGAVSGIVGLAGGMGGFLLPIMFGMLEDFTGIRSTSFMLLYGTVCVSLIWMHFSFKAKRKEIEHA